MTNSMFSTSPNNNIRKAAEVIKKGGIVVFPTDTVFGIGCRWDNKQAVAKIYKIKSRPTSIPFPILLASVEQLLKIAEVPVLAARLIKRYWPGALTIVLNLKNKPKSIGFRIPGSQITRSLISRSGTPIIGTSANFHGQPSVKSSKNLDPNITNQVDYVLEGDCEGGVESTVIDLSGKEPKVVRQGSIKVESYILSINTIKRDNVEVELFNPFGLQKFDLTVSQQTGSQALIPALINVLKKNKISLSHIDEIKVNTGPGSFTGTRVGTAVANTLGFALKIPVNGKIGKIAIPIYEKSKFD